MFYDADHPNITLSEWEAFKTSEAARQSLSTEVIARTDSCIAPWFVPLARGMAVASHTLLRRVGYRPGKACPSGWWEQSPDYFLLRIRFGCFLMVRECDETNLWTVERLWAERRHVDDDEVLVHEFGSTPIVTRNPYSSMRLAVYCHENLPPNGLRWIKASPTDVDAAIEFVGGARQTTPFAQGMRSTRSLECSALEKFTLSPTTLHVLPPASDKVNKVKRSPAR